MSPFLRRAKAILWQRCPECLTGKAFSGSITMRETCPDCGYRFEREQGYFLGAMYISYALSIPMLGLFVLIFALIFPEWRLEWVTLLATVPYFCLVPLVWRWSRTIWMHFDTQR